MTQFLSENIPVSDFNFAVSIGNVADHYFVRKFGQNEDLDVATSPETIWSEGALWVKPTAAQLMSIISTDINDTSGGSGAQTVRVQGLDAAGLLIQETITLDGLTPVLTTKTYKIINRMFVSSAGSSDVNEGIIRATAQLDVTVQANIPLGVGTTLQSIFQIPTGMVGYLTYFFWTVNKSGGANAGIEIEVRATGGDGVRRRVHTSGATSNGSGGKTFDLPVPLPIPEDTIWEVQATSDTNDVSVSNAFHLILRDVDHLDHDLSIISAPMIP